MLRLVNPCGRSRMMRGIAALAALVMVVAVSFIGYHEYDNSRDMPMPSDTELRASFSRASAWILGNRERVLEENNPMLWLFVRDAALLQSEQGLVALAREYQSRHTDHTLTHYLFDPTGSDQVRYVNITLADDVSDYNRLFLYGATCNEGLRDDPMVRSLLTPAACGGGLLWLKSPWCRTHQLMGLRFVQRGHCEPEAETAATLVNVQNLILMELKWDFRVEDAYIQKALTLAESGRRGNLKAVWIRKILDAQRSDGGWDGMDVIARLPGALIFCWGDGLLYPRVLTQRPSTFHATAQALYLMALLLQK